MAPVCDNAMAPAQERREGGSDSAVFGRWTDLIGERSSDNAEFEAILPVNAAANFTGSTTPSFRMRTARRWKAR